MFNFSSKTVVNKKYSVADFLTQINASKEVRQDAKKIKTIVFTNVLNADSLNVKEDKKFENIYVILIELKEKQIPTLFIEELDKNIEFHTYFVIQFNSEYATMIAYKEITDKVKISSKYYISKFKPLKLVDTQMINSVKEMYLFILSHEIGVKTRQGELPSEYIKRVNAINRLNFQISKTEKAIIYETQPKKQFEYNKRLRKYKEELEENLKTEAQNG